MTGSKSFGVRMPLEMYLKMVEVCSKNGVTQTDLVLYSLNRIGLFADDFKLGGEVEIQEKIVYRDKVQYRDKIVYKEGGQALDKLHEKIEELEYTIQRLEAENKKLFDANYDMECRLNKYDPEIIRERSKKEREEFTKKEREREKKERANKPYHDKDGNVKFYDKNGNE